MNFEIAGFSSLSGTQPITWQVEYPHTGTTDVAASEIFVSQKDLVGIVPFAMVSLGGSWVRLRLADIVPQDVRCFVGCCRENFSTFPPSAGPSQLLAISGFVMFAVSHTKRLIIWFLFPSLSQFLFMSKLGGRAH